MARSQKTYRKTVKGKASQLWSAMNQRAGNRAGNYPAYEHIKCLIEKGDFYKWIIPLLNEWVKDKPIELVSLDRIDGDKHYEGGNLQLLTRSENSLKQKRYKNVLAPNGTAWCSNCKEYLNKDYFAKDKYTYNGLFSICKSCKKEVDRLRWQRRKL